ncbi:hypothetical protein HMPREF9999_01708 [Alloprevotella sp. oral taxon 473 str. F0040]|nr:hypothetical protein HMPREF9999_01708 [Alloprevotella sp. oral taxon 473 str. F0040]
MVVMVVAEVMFIFVATITIGRCYIFVLIDMYLQGMEATEENAVATEVTEKISILTSHQAQLLMMQRLENTCAML